MVWSSAMSYSINPHSKMIGFLKNIFTSWIENKGFIFDQIKALRILQLLRAVLVLTRKPVLRTPALSYLSLSLSVPKSPHLTVFTGSVLFARVASGPSLAPSTEANTYR